MLSETVRKHRRRQGWSLRELARRTGISASALSKVERNELSLTYDKLEQLSRGLGLQLSELFHAGGDAPSREPKTRRSFCGESGGEIINTSNYIYRYTHTDLTKKAIIPIIADITARSLEEFGPLMKHSGEEYSYILEGEVTLYTEHYSPIALKSGESIYIDSEMAHAYVNSGSGPARMLCVGSEGSVRAWEAGAQTGVSA